MRFCELFSRGLVPTTVPPFMKTRPKGRRSARENEMAAAHGPITRSFQMLKIWFLAHVFLSSVFSEHHMYLKNGLGLRPTRDSPPESKAESRSSSPQSSCVGKGRQSTRRTTRQSEWLKNYSTFTYYGSLKIEKLLKIFFWDQIGGSQEAEAGECDFDSFCVAQSCGSFLAPLFSRKMAGPA